MSAQDSLPASQTIMLHTGVEITVEKLCTQDFYQLVLALQKLPKRITEFLGKDGVMEFMAAAAGGGEQLIAAVINNVFSLLAAAFNETMHLIAVAVTPTLEDETQEIYNKRAAKQCKALMRSWPKEEFGPIIRAWMEINDVKAIMAELKNAFGLRDLNIAPLLKAITSKKFSLNLQASSDVLPGESSEIPIRENF